VQAFFIFNLGFVMNQHLFRCTFAIVFSVVLAGVALAQSAPLKNTKTLSFKSTLDQYKPYTDEKTADWKAANEQVGKIGGWRTYLKEANESDKPEPAKSKTEPPKPSPQGGVPAPNLSPNANPERPANPHAGHGSK
jgi:hypothetical protein